MDLYQLLKQDHQKAKRLFDRIAETSGGSKAPRARLFAELKHELDLHTEVEEKHFYPALRNQDEAKDLIEEALDEHDEIRKILIELDRADKEEESWIDRVLELQDDVEAHIEEEETEIFPVAQKLLEKARADEIAQAIEAEKAAQKTK